MCRWRERGGEERERGSGFVEKKLWGGRACLRKARVQQGGLMRSERKHGLSTEQFPVSAYVGISKNLRDLKDKTGPPRDRR